MELTQKKKELIQLFMQKGILADPELISSLDNEEKIDSLISIVKDGSSESLALMQSVSRKPQQQQKSPNPQNNIQKAQQTNSGNVEVVFSYKENIKKREIQDFVKYFNNRYNAIKKILIQREDLQNCISIGKLRTKGEKEKIAIIGIISNKEETKNKNLILTLEDPTGTMKVLVNKTKPEIMNIAKDCVLDEVIGITGVNANSIVFANSIYYPDIPLSTEVKKLDKEEYVAILADLHVGSTLFLSNEMNKFIKWINCEAGTEEQKSMASKVKYIFIIGDLVDGVGIYPGQENELNIDDVYEQYSECANILSKIPSHINIIICPGNHDAIRNSEPQPVLSADFAAPLWKLPNVTMVSNPALVNIAAKEGFPGFLFMMYHGYSFDDYGDSVESIRVSRPNISERVDLIMKFLLQRRHLAPTHTSTLYVPDVDKDPLVIEKVPDFFVSGHIHRSAIANYRNVTLICSSCWQNTTGFQEKVGHKPDTGKVPIINLQTREIKMLKFAKEA